ncbi:hypothetical protein [Arthrobacter sp. YN]|uniref:hypothetical protein n=1 Tax=Arthrobacter sp. YN TaxID=2020486 RepID=UPI000B5F8E75|nr:hypothetical protein [Arthrobacter sp. YN]ASN19081.1 hypothetical protein CGK93_04795 [Arthrobacter sp. YN]
MVATDQEAWSEGRSETPDEAYRAGAELSKIFASIDEFYVDGAIKLRAVEPRSSLGGDDSKTAPSPSFGAASRAPSKPGGCET